MRKNEVTLAWLNHLLDPWLAGSPPVAPPSGRVARFGEIYKDRNAIQSDRVPQPDTRRAWCGGLNWSLYLYDGVDEETQLPKWRMIGRRRDIGDHVFYVFAESDATKWVAEGVLPPGYSE
jgi:hypothetical protein